MRPKLCWFAVYRPTRGMPCDPNIFFGFPQKIFFPTSSVKSGFLSRHFLHPCIICSCLCRLFNRMRDPIQLTTLNLSFQPMSVPLTMICVVKWLRRRTSPESKRLSVCLSLSNEQRKSVQYTLKRIPGKKTNRGPVAQCPVILGWAPKTKCLGAQLAPEK